MSKFYGTLSGQSKTAATRRGSKASGVKVSAQSYDGSLVVELKYSKDGELMIKLGASDWTSSEMRDCHTVRELPFNSFVSLLKTAK